MFCLILIGCIYVLAHHIVRIGGSAGDHRFADHRKVYVAILQRFKDVRIGLKADRIILI